VSGSSGNPSKKTEQRSKARPSFPGPSRETTLSCAGFPHTLQSATCLFPGVQAQGFQTPVLNSMKNACNRSSAVAGGRQMIESQERASAKSVSGGCGTTCRTSARACSFAGFVIWSFRAGSGLQSGPNSVTRSSIPGAIHGPNDEISKTEPRPGRLSCVKAKHLFLSIRRPNR
jgi:hypothetical protein